jgi:molybdopterin molybdotransferase
MAGFQELTPLDTALQRLRATITHRITETEMVRLESSLGRILAEDVTARISVPEFDRSAVDGYAVIAEDTYGAAPQNPIVLKLVATIEPGASPLELPTIRRGEAAKIMTGAPIPRGANAVVMAEHAKQTNNKVEITRQVAELQNVSRRGEDYSEGEIIARRGTMIRPWHIAAIAEQNITTVKVLRKPKAALITTGTELAPLGSEKMPGKIIDTNRPMLKALLEEAGAEVVDLGNAPDSVEEIGERIRTGLSTSDLVIITGGTSVGESDLVPEAINKLGEPGVIVHGLRIRPAKPTGIGIINGKPIFMLSGFPVSSYIGFKILVKPCISLMTGAKEVPPPIVRGRLTRRVAKPAGIRAYVRVKVVRTGEAIMVEPLMLTGSGLLSTLTKGNGILEVPEMLEGYEEGEMVEVELTQPLEET